MIIDCAHYRDGRRQDVGRDPARGGRGALPATAASSGWACSSPRPRSSTRSATASACTSWRSRTRRRFHLRPEDRAVRRATCSFVILRTARYDDEREEVEFGEISVFVAPSFVITVRQGVASDLHGARLRLEQRPELLQTRHRGRAVGDPRPGRRRLRARSSPGWSATSSRSRRPCSPARRAHRADLLAAPRGHRLLPRRPPAAGVARDRRARHARRRPELAPYFRDVHDHLRLVNEEVSAQRDLLDHRAWRPTWR